MTLIALVVLFVSALSVRVSLKNHLPTLRRKTGETTQEARLILQGTYRVYTWSMGLALGNVVVNGVVGNYAPWWLGFLNIGFAALLLIFARALYWRLGYPSTRIILMLEHLSGLSALTECMILRREIATVSQMTQDPTQA